MKALYFLPLVALLAATGCNQKPEESIATDYTDIFQVEDGTPAGVGFTAYSTTLIADGTDMTELRITITDSTGKEIRSASRPVEISITGDAKLLHPDEGKELIFNEKYDSALIWYSSVENGLCCLFLQAGTEAGKINIEVRSDSLWPASHEFHTLPATFIDRRMNTVVPPQKDAASFGKMIGADISFLPQLEERNTIFLERGESWDAIKLLKKHGFNYIRLRIFVNPEKENGYSPGEGFCDLEHTKAMALRVKEAGMKLLLDFHYSDYWADPQKQLKPEEWSDLGYEDLKQRMADYTRDVINALTEQGTPPDMVQVGNEINHGFLWPDGHISNPDQLAGLLKAGLAAVKSCDSTIVTMVHLALGGQNQEASFWLDNMIARGVDFDILGISYYSRWHGTLNDLKDNLEKLVSKYGRPVNVVEYSGYKSEIQEIVFNLPDNMGNGTCIWEPLNTWNALFNKEGRATEELDLYDGFARKYLGTDRE